MCASLCASPTPCPSAPLHAGPQPYQQECRGIVWSAAAVTSWQPVKGNSRAMAPSFLLIASATRCPVVDRPLRPGLLYESSNDQRKTRDARKMWIIKVLKDLSRLKNLFDRNVCFKTRFVFQTKPFQ